MIKALEERSGGGGVAVAGPSPQADGLGRRLARLRRSAGISGQELAERTGMSQSKISRIETGVTTPSMSDIEVIAAKLEISPGDLDGLRSMLGAGLQDWRADGSRFRSLQQDIAQYEQPATTIRMLQTLIVPGLLQTAEYARAVLSAYERLGQTDNVQISNAIVKRMERQRIFDDPAKRIRIVFLESVLHYRLCSPSVMLAQIERLLQVSLLPNVSMRIVPLMAELPAALPHPVEIFDDTALTIDLATTALFSDARNDLEFYSRVFELYFEAGTENVGDVLTEAYQRFAKLATLALPRLREPGD